MSTTVASDPRMQELIAFRMEEQEFCVGVTSIREIRGWTATTPLPATPPYVRGVINLRGTVLPIVDLAVRLGFAAATPTPRHAIIVAQIKDQIVGLLVAGVSDIFTIDESKIQPTPDVASVHTKDFVCGMIPMEDRLISMIAIESILPQTTRDAA